ncbi:Putative proton-dependent oligopeptide transporter family, MFS transporter superfamily [Colletotrichum destructivum]|uniref:Proton-dependent oligopeptide transporter family, MFS transporter superfamily n=1 Tax=Colletotrichum destructivum TaxID=34406 RepID=A0AAX4I2H0_9PEZI|nr:Putative proton-dependent oligopeptide transporter family, MFS transporter superfamily [Colletotrichum destructivum]
MATRIDTYQDGDKDLSEVSSAKIDSELAPTPDGGQPTEHEKTALRLVSDTVPLAAWLVCVVETAERFTYYALSGPFQNYMQYPYGNKLIPGALGLGQANASSISYGFMFWMYLTPMLGAYIADSYAGRMRTISGGAALYICGLAILFITSLPFSLERGAGLGGFVTALLLIGAGAGFIKANVGIMIFEQYTETKQRVKTLRSGERVILDPQTTISNIYMIFYNVLCIGCLSGIPATYIEHRIGFWAAFLVPFCVFWIAIFTLYFGRKTYVQRVPEPVLGKAFSIFRIAIKSGFNMDAAKPSYQAQHGGNYTVTWDDKFVDELKRSLYACKVFIPQPIAWLCYLQALNNLVSQAGTMERHGLPNDILYNFTLIIEIVLIHVFRTGLYPLLRKWHVGIGPIRRITAGFLAGTLAIAWAAIVQKIIYSAGPCYDAPLACEASEGGTIPNRVHVMLQFPSYVLFALSEVGFAITASEYAYTKAPKSMKSIIGSINYLTVAVAALLGMAVSRAASDPGLTWLYTSLAIVYFVVTCLFWYFCHGYDKLEDELFDLDREDNA